MKIPYVNLKVEDFDSGSKQWQAVVDVMKSGNFILGDFVKEFEKNLASLHDLPYAVGVGSGLDALFLTLKALNIGSGDEVITVPNSFIATASAIALVGAKPVFVDVDEDQTMSPQKLAEAVSDRTKAIIPVHLNGRPSPMKEIMEIADQYSISVIEDCAQSIGAKLDGMPLGSFGIAGCYSFHPLKNLNACGDGGGIVTSNADLVKRLHLIRNHGLLNRNTCVEWANNSRLDALQAAILNEKLSHLQEIINQRRENADYYFENLKGLPVRLPFERKGEYCVWQAFVIQTENRNELQKFLSEGGVESLIHYPIPIHLQPVARSLGYEKGSFPMCERQAEIILSLPIRQSLERDDLGLISRLLKEFFARQ